MFSVDSARELLQAGHHRELAALLVEVDEGARRAVCKPLTGQARAIMNVSSGSTVESWLRDLRSDYPGGTAQFVDAWRGRLTDRHWDAATAVLLGAKQPSQAAKVWPIPHDLAFAEWLYPALFPKDLSVIVSQWCADFVAAPKHWDRNHGRGVLYNWVERGLVEPPQNDGAVLMLLGQVAAAGDPLLQWLLARPKVTDAIFTRVFRTTGVRGASLMQTDDGTGNDPMRTIVVPGLVKEGVWTRDFVVQETQAALQRGVTPYQRRWFVRLAADLGIS